MKETLADKIYELIDGLMDISGGYNQEEIVDFRGQLEETILNHWESATPPTKGTQIEEFVKICQALDRDYQYIKDELAKIKKLLGPPAYVVCKDEVDSDAYQELRGALCKPLRPGGFIPLSTEAFELYKRMLPCPPRR